MKPQPAQVYLATVVLQCPQRMTSCLPHFGQENFVVPSRLVMRFLHDVQVSSAAFAFAMASGVFRWFIKIVSLAVLERVLFPFPDGHKNI
jgi:hypothetical protein